MRLFLLSAGNVVFFVNATFQGFNIGVKDTDHHRIGGELIPPLGEMVDANVAKRT